MKRFKLLTAFFFTAAIISMSACTKQTPESPDSETAPTITAAPAQPSDRDDNSKIQPPADWTRPAENTVSAYDAVLSDYTLQVDATNKLHDVSDLLMGIFIEDINFAADGGLYAEKIVNRSFEFTKIAKKDQMYGWQTVGTIDATVTVGDFIGSLNENNLNYLILSNSSGEPAGIANAGFLDGISVVENETYDFSIYARPENLTAVP